MRATQLCVNQERMRANFEALSAIGSTADGGVHRPALGEAHLKARRWFRERASEAGLDVYIDGAGNHVARLRCGPAGARALLLGSHLDSVPHGGRFDGALGVLCALEVVQTVQDAGLSLLVDLEAIDFTDEEGGYVGLMGSRALTGKLRASDLQRAHPGCDAFESALAQAGLDWKSVLLARRDPSSILAYLEVHIEQGPRLIESGIDIGIVTDIVGIRWIRQSYLGRADHAGTTPMADRRDAAQGASAFVLAARKAVLQDFDGCVVNVGDMAFAPGAFNVVPARVDLKLEFRGPDIKDLDRLDNVLIDLARAQATRFDLDLEIERLEAIDPVPMDGEMQDAIGQAVSMLGLTHVSLASGAGHDAQALAGLCPAGMIFVPSVGGRSHSAQEFTRWGDCINGANVLLHTVLNIAGG